MSNPAPELVEQVAQAIASYDTPPAGNYISKAQAVIPIIESALLREMMDAAPPEPVHQPPFSPSTPWGTRAFLRKIARERGLLEGEELMTDDAMVDAVRDALWKQRNRHQSQLDDNESVDGLTRDARAAIAACKPQWQPIETAPKDGTPVDLWCSPRGLSAGGGRTPDCWYSIGKWWRYDEKYGDDQCRVEVGNATHWIPLPEPPQG